MLDIGWQELIVVGMLALLVVGPKELPGLLRTVGQWAGRAKSVARDFQRSMDDAAREADLAELKELTNVKRDVEKMGVSFTDQAKKVQESLANPTVKGPQSNAAKAGGAMPSTELKPDAKPAPEAAPEPASNPGAKTGAKPDTAAAPAAPSTPGTEAAPTSDPTHEPAPTPEKAVEPKPAAAEPKP